MPAFSWDRKWNSHYVEYEDMDTDEWLTNVPLEIVYQKLQVYREEKNKLRQQHIRKYRN